ncbi:MAG: AAA family ATPase [Azospirillaceae bacterium]
MSYLAHFGLARPPFALTPDSDLVFGDTPARLLAALDYSLDRGDGLLAVVGEVGTGKTLLARLLARRVADRAEPAMLVAPATDLRGLMRLLCRELGLSGQGARDELALALQDRLLELHASGRPAVLIVDEAQALGPEGLEAIRLLSNLETDRAKLLRIVLFGQPELDRLLARHGLRQIRDRLAFRLETAPFDPAAARAYIAHRVDRCSPGGGPNRVFADRAAARIARVSRGFPRRINVLADRALLAAYAEGARRVERAHVAAAEAEDGARLTGAGRWLRRAARPVG